MHKPLPSPLRTLAIALVPLALVATACGSDDKPTTTEAPTDSTATGDTTATDSGDAGSNADVEAFCNQVDQFVEAMNKLIADPTSGDAAALAQEGQDLLSSATALSGSVTGDDAARIKDCTKNLENVGS